jgi:alpha-L-arabinofuranosidase
VATYLNIFVRNCAWVAMANLAQLVNAIAPVITTPGTAITQPIYYPLLLHAQAALDAAADVHVDGPTVSPLGPGHSRWPHRVADLGPFRMVDAAATVSPGRRQLALTLLNRNPDQPETTEIVLRDHAFDGAAKIRTLTADPGRDGRTLPDVEAVHLSEGSQTPRGQALTLILPAQSFTVVEAAMTSR